MDVLLADNLIAILCRGEEAMPRDFAGLRACLEGIHDMLAEKSREDHPDLASTSHDGAEIETLLEIEAAIARTAIAIPSEDAGALLGKLEIWEMLSRHGDDAGEGEHLGRDRIVRSVIEDLRRLDAAQDAQGGSALSATP